MGLLASFLTFFKGLFGYEKQRDAENNTAPMQANAQAQQIQKDKAAAAEEVSSGNLEKLREETAE
ncbi:MAG TPA: hypothetical protein VGG34_01400 [Opitutaceae bacterium]|jgi:hypothetical protein